MSCDKCFQCGRVADCLDSQGRYVCREHDNETKPNRVWPRLIGAMMLPWDMRCISEAVIDDLAPKIARENRNRPCKCGSGKLTKFCCGKKGYIV